MQIVVLNHDVVLTIGIVRIQAQWILGTDVAGIDRPEPVRPEELLVRTALSDGEFRGPVSGFLYFAYKGKPSGIKSLDLLYEDAVLKLR